MSSAIGRCDFSAAELVREAAFDSLSQELPYELAVEVVEWDEKRPDLVRIRANLLVERASQKQIVIGRGGQGIKRIGVRARREIEKSRGATGTSRSVGEGRTEMVQEAETAEGSRIRLTPGHRLEVIDSEVRLRVICQFLLARYSSQ